MDYEQRYKEALAKAEQIKHGVETIGCSMDKDMLDIIFPELAESKDEKIRKVLIEHFKGSHSSIFPYKGFTKEQILAWLEKQKPVEWSDEDKEMIERIIFALPKMANGIIGILPSIAEEYAERLKSLQPPYHCDDCKLKKSLNWKPSEEQLEVLDMACNDAIGKDYHNALRYLWSKLKAL